MAEITISEAVETGPTQPEAPAPDRPKWLPEKFKTPEDLVASYGELEKKLGSVPGRDAQGRFASSTETQNAPEGGQATAPDKGTGGEQTPPLRGTLEKWQKTYAEKGELPEEAYKEIEGFGIPREMASTYLDGLKARQTLEAKQEAEEEARLYAIAGGKDEFSRVQAWAIGNLPEKEIEAFNAAMDSDHPGVADLAMQGLVSKYHAANGRPAQVSYSGAAVATGSDSAPYAGLDAMLAHMKDPRYEKDPEFRAMVQRRIEASPNLWRGR